MRRAASFALLLLTACSVDRSVLDEQVFPCRRDGDCIAGYGCQLIDAVGHGFCAPERDDPAACDGYLTADGLCLAECVPGGDSCGVDLACLSSDIIGGQSGFCAPADACVRDSDCSSDEVCMNRVVDDFVDVVWGPRPFPVARELSCVPRCDGDGQCPAGTECLDSLIEGLAYCLPRCGDDSACPLGLACYATTGTSIGICLPGVPGLACRDDSNCLAGPCATFPDPQGGPTVSVCATPCDVSSGGGPCGTAPIEEDRLNVLHCMPFSDGDFCVFRPGYLHGCEPNWLGQGVSNCAPGLTCDSFPAEGGGEVTACAKPCTWSAVAPNNDANQDCTDNAFCFRGSLIGLSDLCAFDLPNGSACTSGDQCVSRYCDPAPAAPCGEDEALGCCATP